MFSGRSSAYLASVRFASADCSRTDIMYGCWRRLRICSPRGADCWQRREDPHEIRDETRSDMKSEQKCADGWRPDRPRIQFVGGHRLMCAASVEKPGKSDLPYSFRASGSVF